MDIGPAQHEFFLDRSLGRVQVPRLLTAAGFVVRTLADVYGIPADEDVADVDWLRLAGNQGWPVLMKDERIRRRPAETQALTEHGVRAFCLTSGNLRAAEMAAQYIAVADAIFAACRMPGPALYSVSTTGLRRTI